MVGSAKKHKISIDMDSNNISNITTTGTSYTQYNTTASVPTQATGLMYWNDADKAISYWSDVTSVTHNLNQELHVRVTNKTGSPITKGSIVYINGVQGNRPTIALAKADADSTSAGTLGMVVATIADNGTGIAVINGIVDNLNTDSFLDGDLLYLSPTTAGEITATKPHAPDHEVRIGVVLNAHLTQGKVFVRVINGYELDEIHDVHYPITLANGHVLQYNLSNTRWENRIFKPEQNIDWNTYDITNITKVSSKNLDLKGLTSGTITIAPASVAGTWTLTLPDSDGNAGQFLQTDGSGVTTWATATGGGGGLTWSEITGTSQTMSVNTGYIANNAGLVTLTLPSTSAVGDVVRVTGKGAGGWRIAQPASVVIHFGNTDTTTGTGGYLQFTHRRDSVELVCVVANTEWNVVSSMGNIDLV
jgi:hypothetical protein